jgi:predicted dinucleotide-binding enzyme
MSENQLTIAVIGGTGNLGQGLAYQLARVGHRGITGEPGIA